MSPEKVKKSQESEDGEETVKSKNESCNEKMEKETDEKQKNEAVQDCVKVEPKG